MCKFSLLFLPFPCDWFVRRRLIFRVVIERWESLVSHPYRTNYRKGQEPPPLSAGSFGARLLTYTQAAPLVVGHQHRPCLAVMREQVSDSLLLIRPRVTARATQPDARNLILIQPGCLTPPEE
jgi:hypothetical protein